MRVILAAAVLLAAPAAAAARTDGVLPTGPAPAVVHLVWNDPAHLLPADFDEMAREVAAIFRPLGTRVVWRRADDRPASGDEINVILLPADPAGRLHGRSTMGRVQRTRNTALWIFAGRVRQTIGLEPDTVRRVTLEERSHYPRALGRVVAHELVHAIALDQPHADRGLMQASLNRTLLTAPRVAVDQRCARAFVRELAIRSGE